jgi:hypothetical protein
MGEGVKPSLEIAARRKTCGQSAGRPGVVPEETSATTTGKGQDMTANRTVRMLRMMMSAPTRIIRARAGRRLQT